MEFSPWYELTRAAHLGACALGFGVWGFDRMVAGETSGQGCEAIGRRWDRIVRGVVAGAIAAALLSGGLWFLFVASSMGGITPGAAMDRRVLGMVLGTHFGFLWEVRLGCWGAAVAQGGLFAVFCGGRRRAVLAWTGLVVWGVLAGSLAWTGHAVIGSSWHRAADVVHLLAGCGWVGGLMALGLFLREVRDLAALEGVRVVEHVARRFSILGMACVAGLFFTGLVNGLFLVRPFGGVLWTAYGRLLLVKVGLFAVMAGLGAVNLFRLRPRLRAAAEGGGDAQMAAQGLRMNVALECVVGVGIVLIVGVLGLMTPGGE